jgi:hypothetical protein
MPEKSRRASTETSEKQEGDGDNSTALSTVADRAATVVKGRLTDTLDKSVDDLDLLAKTLQLASEQLKDNMAAPYLGKVANRVSRLSRFIDEADPKALVEQAQTLGREKPLWFLGGAMALGFAGGRFLRSSSSAGSTAPSTGGRASKNEAPRNQNSRNR